MTVYNKIACDSVRLINVNQAPNPNRDLVIKLAAVGDPTIGKSALLKAAADTHHVEDFYLTSIAKFEVAFQSPAHDGILEMYDMASMVDDCRQHSDEDIRSRASNCENADVFLLCFAIDSRDSFEDVRQQLSPQTRKWLKQERIPVVLVGLKGDIRVRETLSVSQLVSTQEAASFAKEIRACAYLECSSLTDEGVSKVMETALAAGLKHRFHKRCNIM